VKVEVLGGKLSQRHFIQLKSRMDWLGIEPVPSQCEGVD